MTSLERIGIEIAAALMLCGAFVGWWTYHNHAEQKIGAQACIQSTTETKREVIADNAADAGAEAHQLTVAVQTYAQQVSDLSSRNADLAQRLHDNPIRQIPASRPGSAAAGAGCALDLPDGQAGARAAAIDAATKKIFDDCDADYAGRVAVIGAYNEWRERMIGAQK